MGILLGIFADPRQADEAVNELRDTGFRQEDISVIMREGKVVAVPEGGRGAEIARDTVTGVTTGGAIGGVAGLIIGIAAITIPGIGGLLVAGPLAIALGLGEIGATTFAGAVTGAAAGGLIGALVGVGVPEKKAKIYEEAIRKGQILLSVTTTAENEAIAKDIIEKHGASQVCNIAENK
ncbi:MAG: DUF3341 domain-containing protein [Patescibacteria group bacterium]|nr:DUF3341 domain-containing protein [Patescibacteria group bacterium]